MFFAPVDDGYRIAGCTTAVQDGAAWTVDYEIVVDGSFRTRTATVSSRTSSGRRSVTVASDGRGGWTVDGTAAPELTGCLDVDLEASACTNALPVRRLALDAGQRAEAPAVYVRAADAAVERLEQTYLRTPVAGEQRYAYRAPAFDFGCELAYDDTGLVTDYPGIAVRVA